MPDEEQVAHIRVYVLNEEYSALRYQGERPDGSVIEGCVETAISTDASSRQSALVCVVEALRDAGYTLIEIPTTNVAYVPEGEN